MRDIIFLSKNTQEIVRNLELSGQVHFVNLSDKNICDSYTDVFHELLSYFKELSMRCKNENVLSQVVFYGEDIDIFEGFCGFLSSIHLENDRIIPQLLLLSEKEDIEEILDKEAKKAEVCFVRYVGGKRYTRVFEKEENFEKKDSGKKICLWKDNGVYLITGGGGGLGLSFAKHISDTVSDATIFLIGQKERNVSELCDKAGIDQEKTRVKYFSCDIGDRDSVKKLARKVKKEYGEITGIIHSAGITRDSFFMKKSLEDADNVLRPKVYGLVNLDEAFADIPVEFWLLMSSSAGALGNVGQTDYASANGFMDAYARRFNKQNKNGTMISINWPLWKSGGMQVDEQVLDAIFKSTGLVPLETDSAFTMLDKGIEDRLFQFIPTQGNQERVSDWIEGKNNKKVKETESKGPKADKDFIEAHVKEILSALIRMPKEQIDSRVPMEDYGLSSIMTIEFTERLEKDFGSLPRTLFFEVSTLRELAQYLADNCGDKIKELTGKEEKNNDVKVFRPLTKKQSDEKYTEISEKYGWGLAIIGLSGSYPGSEDVDTLWENIRAGKDLITEIPKDRWDHSAYYDEDKTRTDRTYARWGGFLEDADCFDPLFFNISPVEALGIDPQERLFLQCVYHAVEDAGYTRWDLSREERDDLANRVGLFVGVMYEEYQLYGAQAQQRGEMYTLNGSEASIANRVSYTMGFHGPCMSVDSMCSSSLSAIHLACRSILNGECDMAVAGGVNLSVHPNKFLMLGQSRFLSAKGHCAAFGEGGDGYVPGEGVGAVVIKPLDKAISDGDHIYGIIRGSAINHSGKTNGYTVPNPKAQTGVILDAWRAADIEPRSVSYIEAHGTGTELGDPIEITGITKAFDTVTKDKQFVNIGSVKANIGHCESAAGIASLSKVLLQMEHREIAPSILSEPENPHIHFEETPCKVPHECIPWKRPVISRKEYPRIAGISAFGAGGTNAHLVVQEAPVMDDKKAVDKLPVFVLSAKGEKQLKLVIEKLCEFLENNKKEIVSGDISLWNIAYTLLVGREPLENRFAVVAHNVDELISALNESDGYTEILSTRNILHSRVEKEDDRSDEVIKLFDNEEYDEFAKAWTKGLIADFRKVFDKKEYRRISLPGYPFKKEHLFKGKEAGKVLVNTEANPSLFIHPLIHRNVSVLSEQRYESIFDFDEPFFSDHRVNGKRTLPGVIYLEMVRAAYLDAIGAADGNVTITDTLWAKPITVEDGEKVKVLLTLKSLKDDKKVEFDISTLSGDSRQTCCTGRVCENTTDTDEEIDINELKNEAIKEASGDKLYSCFDKIGISYGKTQRSITAVFNGKDYALVELRLPEEARDKMKDYVLYPAMLDGALQGAIGLSSDGLLFDDSSEGRASVPFMLHSFRVFAGCSAKMWAKLSKSKEHEDRVDIAICDDKGKVLAKFDQMCYKHTREETLAVKKESVSTVKAVNKNESGKIKLLIDIFAESLMLSKEDFNEETLFEDLGIDSILSMKITDRLEKDFGPLPKTLLFEYQTIETLAEGLPDIDGDMQEEDFVSTEQENADYSMESHFHKAPENDWDDEIAIIGVAGSYAKAENIYELWKNLENGRDCITTIPEERWDYHDYEDISYAKYGGFIDGVDQFDPMFFHITPNLASVMDPNERLFLETVYHAVEDAGYTKKALGYKPGSKIKRKIGVFAGVMNELYGLEAAQEHLREHQVAVSTQTASVANQVSHFFDFHGPSLTMDSMCSSSLVTIHLACQAIKTGECEMAIAGGVNTLIHPDKFLAISQSKMASPTGSCKSFGEGGDGYAPGEGVGALLLKKKSQAVKDGDHIYATIIGTSVNHCGRVSAYMVPNPVAQTEVIRQALDNAGISARQVSVIEAHGTGTSLGDPIEVNSITDAFRQYTRDEAFCSIGSIKSNIGHCEAAAGVAAVTKVLLEMKNKKLAPSIHSERENPNLSFKGTPFRLQKKLEDWTVPSGKRIAGVSAFGAGGTNAHIILKEYDEDRQISYVERKEWIIISAITEKSLMQNVKNLLDFLKEEDGLLLGDIARTLIEGREAFEMGVAFKVETVSELKKVLEDYIGGKDCDVITAPEKIEEIRKNYEPNGKRISLPGYAFDHMRCWIEISDKAVSASGKETISLSGQEKYIKDHIVNESHVLPGSGILELVRKSAALQLGSNIYGLEDIMWLQPLVVEKATSIRLSINDDKRFELKHGNALIATGRILAGNVDIPVIDKNTLAGIEGLSTAMTSGRDCYEQLKAAGLESGTSFTVIKEIKTGSGAGYASLERTEADEEGTVISPTLLNGVFQTVSSLVSSDEADGLMLPFALGHIEVYKPFTDKCLVYIRKESGSGKMMKFSMLVTDENKNAVCSIENFTIRAFDSGVKHDIEHFYTEHWTKSEKTRNGGLHSGDELIVFGGNNKLRDALDAASKELSVKIRMTENERVTDWTASTAEELSQKLDKTKNILIVADSSDHEARMQQGIYFMIKLTRAINILKPRDKINVVFAYDAGEDEILPEYEGLDGFAKSIRIENPLLCYRILKVQNGNKKVSEDIFAKEMINAFEKGDLTMITLLDGEPMEKTIVEV